jgi:superfamily I DNA and/or RNA helicase
VETAKEENMHISLFEQIQNRYGSEIIERLRIQYRMNGKIAGFVSEEFYEDSLLHGDNNRDWTVSDLKPIVAFDTNAHEQSHEESSSKYNEFEAGLVAKQVRLLQMNGLESSEIGVITPYTAQVGIISKALKEQDVHNPFGVKIDTVDSFQGSEREAIIVSFVRSNSYHASGFLEFPEEGRRRLNVALTRAKKRLVLIGDFDTLGRVATHLDEDKSCAPVYQRLQEYLMQLESIKSVST